MSDFKVQNYVDYFKCVEAKGEDFAPCKQFQKAYKSLCPPMWTEKWDEQREADASPHFGRPAASHH
ncbi:Cytochrome c oxidase subunit 6B [Allomyces arbusculus]|nr:Cytochrome c oxidase subunit 6B [Allomyces arbusculus]